MRLIFPREIKYCKIGNGILCKYNLFQINEVKNATIFYPRPNYLRQNIC